MKKVPEEEEADLEFTNFEIWISSKFWLNKVKAPEEEEADLEFENLEIWISKIWISKFWLKKVKVPEEWVEFSKS